MDIGASLRKMSELGWAEEMQWAELRNQGIDDQTIAASITAGSSSVSSDVDQVIKDLKAFELTDADIKVDYSGANNLGYGTGWDAQVRCEAGPYDWAITMSMAYMGGDVLVEPYNGWVLNFYDQSKSASKESSTAPGSAQCNGCGYKTPPSSVVGVDENKLPGVVDTRFGDVSVDAVHDVVKWQCQNCGNEFNSVTLHASKKKDEETVQEDPLTFEEQHDKMLESIAPGDQVKIDDEHTGQKGSFIVHNTDGDTIYIKRPGEHPVNHPDTEHGHQPAMVTHKQWVKNKLVTTTAAGPKQLTVHARPDAFYVEEYDGTKVSGPHEDWYSASQSLNKLLGMEPPPDKPSRG